MKKEPIIYFPNSTAVKDKLTAKVGQQLAIGKPSKQYYEYINHSLNYNFLELKDFKALLKLEGIHVKIVSILNMKSGNQIAVLRRKDGRDFLKNIEKLFADLNKGLASRELKLI